MKLSNAEDSHSSISAESTECVNAVDRGGLCHVSDNTFLFFCSIEEALRAFLTVLKVKELSHGMKSTIVKSVIDNEDVAFHWSIVAVEADEEEEILLEKIIELWVAIRGFSFARSWMEMFKQSTKKGTQRSKALR